MATWYLLNSVEVGTATHHAGTLINDAIFSTTAITTAGGYLVPSATSGMSAAATAAQYAMASGQGDYVATQLMCNAALISFATTIGGSVLLYP
jgi:hypothetical protein